MSVLYHVSGWSQLARVQVGESFSLVPGRQCAEGVGVYFSEEKPRLSAAEGAQGKPTAAIRVQVQDASGWWQSKGAKAKKFGKPRTWHSDGKQVMCQVVAISEIILECGPVRMLECAWTFERE